jgi:hypothetical protein
VTPIKEKKILTVGEKWHAFKKKYVYAISPAYVDRIGFIIFCTVFIVQ